MLQDFAVRISLSKQVIPNNAYGVFDGKLIICDEILVEVYDRHVGSGESITIVPLGVLNLGISIICLLLLFMVYGMLPTELRNIRRLNLTKSSLAFLFVLTFCSLIFSLYC